MEGRGEERDKWREGGRSEGGRKKGGGSEGGKRGEREGGREGGGKGEREERGDGKEGVKEGREERRVIKGTANQQCSPMYMLVLSPPTHPPTRPECHISPAMTGEGCHCWLESVSLCNFTVLPTLNYNYVRTPSCVTVKNSSICVACA